MGEGDLVSRSDVKDELQRSLEEGVNAVSGESDPVVTLINKCILSCLVNRAKEMRIRRGKESMEIHLNKGDGLSWQEWQNDPVSSGWWNATAARLKIMAGLEYEQRLWTQLGKVELKVGGTPLEIKVVFVFTDEGQDIHLLFD